MENYLASSSRYDSMSYRRCGRSGLLLPAISLGLATAMGLDPMRVGFGLVGLSCLGAATSVMLAPMATRLIALFVR